MSALNGIDDFLADVVPHLNSDLRKSFDPLKKILELFPGQSLAEIEKNVRSLIHEGSARNSVAAMIDRLKAFVHPPDSALGVPNGQQPDSIGSFLADAENCNVADLKKIAKGIHLEAATTKKAIIADLRRWVESKGQYAPTSATNNKEQMAKELAGDFPERMNALTPELAAEIIRRAESASNNKQLGADGFKIFASLLIGTSVKGSKAEILAKIKGFVERLADSYARTGSSSR